MTPSSSRNTETEVVIIGAGVVGCSIALALSRAGIRSHNVDTLPAPGYGSTSHSSAIIRPFYSHVTACAIAHQARCHWLRWGDFLGSDDPRGLARYEERGGLILIRSGEEDQYTANLAALAEVGIDHEIVDQAALARWLPQMDFRGFGPPVAYDAPAFATPSDGEIVGAIRIPAAGYVNDPQLASHNLCHAAKAHGAAFSFGVAVTALLDDASGRAAGVVLDNGERITSRFVVNAAGPHSGVLNRQFGISLPLTTAAHRHEVAYVRAPEGLATTAGFFADLDAGVYLRPDGDDVMIGTTDPACDDPDIVAPDDYNDQLSDHWTRHVMRAAQRFPELAIESRARGTVGLYDVSDDWIPLYDKTDRPGYYVAIGTSGNQFKNAPLIGEIMHAVIAQEMMGIDHDANSAHLHLPDLGREVDLAFYSRKREVQSTNSVLA